MPQNGSRHDDDALGRAGKPENDQKHGRGEGESLTPDREASGPRVRDLRGSRNDSADRASGATAGATAGNPGEDIPNVFEGLSPDLTVGTDLPEDVAKLTSERDELLDSLRRMQADFENYKKRVERQSAEQRDRANERIVENLLPALDAFSIARTHIGDADTSSEVRALLQAAALFEAALEKEGLERIAAEGAPFDPAAHEAVEFVSADEDSGSNNGGDDVADAEIVGAGSAPGVQTVSAVYRPGYTWKGRVIRPAMVRVRG